MQLQPFGIHWFRRDLRVAGNPALAWAVREFGGRVLGLFCFDAKFLARDDFSPDRFAFFLDTLAQLATELRELGGDLLVLDVGPREAFGQMFTALGQAGASLPRVVSFNRDYEPFAAARDAEVAAWLPREFGVAVHTERDHLLNEPDEILRDGKAGQYYQVYTPFAKRWFAKLAEPEVQSRIASQKMGLAYLQKRAQGKSEVRPFSMTWRDCFGGAVPLADQLYTYQEQNRPHVRVPIPRAGSVVALERLKAFGKTSLGSYATRRDLPGIDGTSQLSIYLKNGSLTTAQILAALEIGDPPFELKDGATTFVKELAWREFYYHILAHRPEVETTAFLEKYRRLEWENSAEHFEAWKAGRTGYPIVDAGMRQLDQTGWMHNRVRMIVASFLVKDLLIDWRWGERYFMERLLDGDLAPNNGGWQWAASTGCDPQPYFRIFNPKLQGQKFDPAGDYVRRWVPELAEVPAKWIHEPHRSGIALDYPPPIVDHAERKALALSLYRGAS